MDRAYRQQHHHPHTDPPDFPYSSTRNRAQRALHPSSPTVGSEPRNVASGNTTPNVPTFPLVAVPSPSEYHVAEIPAVALALRKEGQRLARCICRVLVASAF